jgi:DNA repair protein RadC
MPESEKLSIKNWAEDDRPRERFLEKGAASLSDAELIAILIGSGSRNESAVDLAKRILHQSGNNLFELGQKSIQQLQKHKGIGTAKAVTIAAAMELARRRSACEPQKKQIIRSSKDIFEIFGPLLGDLPHEEFWVIFLNRNNKVTAKQRISTGGISSTVVDIRLIMKSAVENSAVSLVICHNHPSGNLMPGKDDKLMTQRIKDAGQIMEILLLDHVIIGQTHYFSFADEGIL